MDVILDSLISNRFFPKSLSFSKNSHQIMQISEKHDNRFAFSSHKNSVSGETFHFQKKQKITSNYPSHNNIADQYTDLS
jgi:hypothetical protein